MNRKSNEALAIWSNMKYANTVMNNLAKSLPKSTSVSKQAKAPNMNPNMAKEAKPKVKNPSFISSKKQYYGPPFGQKNK